MSANIQPKLPQTTSYGEGSDKIVLKIAQDFYLTDAQFVVLVDGVQVGGTFSASATRASGDRDILELNGYWGSGAHEIKVSFLNDARNIATGEDRNLFVMGGSYNGVDFATGCTPLWSRFSASFSAAATDECGVGARATAGRDMFVVGADSARQVISGFTASGDNADVVRLEGLKLTGFQEVMSRASQVGRDTVITFDQDVSVRLTGVNVASLTAANFEIVNLVTKPKGTQQEIGSGSDTLVLNLTQSFHLGGDAQFTVSVDGQQVGGIWSSSAIRLSREKDVLTLHGDWGAGDHVVSVTFLNDAYNRELKEDRNLFIERATMNGVVIAEAAQPLFTKGSVHFIASIAAAAVPIPTAPDDSSPVPGPVEVSGPAVIPDTTHDVFDYSRGDGGKVLDRFSATGEGADVVRLMHYGYADHALAKGVASYTSFADLLPHISQQGSDTVVRLSDTDNITLKNVSAASLSAANFSFISDITGPMNAYTDNGWIVFNNTWGSGDLTYRKDYTVSASYDPAALATGTTFTWSYPPPSVSWTKVLGYPSLMFGKDTYDNVQGDFDPAQILPIKVGDLDRITSAYHVAYGGQTEGFDVAYDIWLTSIPDGKWNHVTNEVMIWLHRGDLSGFGEVVGTYSDGTYSAAIYHTGTYTALVPDKDYTQGSIDIGAVLGKLKELGIVSDKEYVNQIDLGAEPIKGAGYLTINSLSYDIQSREEGGIIKTSHADGGLSSIVLTGTAGADVLDAKTAKIATLIGGAGNDSFLFTKGEVGDVTVQDFHFALAGGGEHDQLKFMGYGEGATLSHEQGDLWAITYHGGVDHIHLPGVSHLSAADYLFM